VISEDPKYSKIQIFPGSLQRSPDPIADGKGASCSLPQQPHPDLSFSGLAFWVSAESSSLQSSLADLGFLEGVTLGTRASIEGVWAYGRMKFERL